MLELSVKAGREAPLILVGHSMGTAILSNLIYDLQNGKVEEWLLIGAGKNPLPNGQTLASVFFMGCPAAIWETAQDTDSPIQVPAPEFAARYPEFYGHINNIMSPSDPLAMPLEILSSEYAAVTRDITIETLGFLRRLTTRVNPVSMYRAHVGYWSSEKVADAVANECARVWFTVNH